MLDKLVQDIEAVDDPGKRGALATEALDKVKDINARLAAIRQAAARELKDQGLTLVQIGEVFGPPGKALHFSRIQQILKGGKTGRWAKVAREAEERSPES